MRTTILTFSISFDLFLKFLFPSVLGERDEAATGCPAQRTGNCYHFFVNFSMFVFLKLFLEFNFNSYSLCLYPFIINIICCTCLSFRLVNNKKQLHRPIFLISNCFCFVFLKRILKSYLMNFLLVVSILMNESYKYILLQ